MFHARKITDDGRQVTLQYFPNGDWTLPAPCYSLLDDHAVKNIYIVCPNNTVPSTHPQLDIIREKIAMKDNVKLTIEINASISTPRREPRVSSRVRARDAISTRCCLFWVGISLKFTLELFHHAIASEILLIY
jgi:hypothetical protein